jgi:hypothetical protein
MPPNPAVDENGKSVSFTTVTILPGPERALWFRSLQRIGKRGERPGFLTLFSPLFCIEQWDRTEGNRED